eukprot:TRINITY_DN18274_c0_g1_i1.p1 TRINITY_DN18274_c0_g1~~TRINITY_DN18274_c0_g1_i1.p1  ORF type:complete len:741 (+),score=186.95 TRINITY_DN18274_c0_g1_i1:78-2300(+)
MPRKKRNQITKTGVSPTPNSSFSLIQLQEQFKEFDPAVVRDVYEQHNGNASKSAETLKEMTHKNTSSGIPASKRNKIDQLVAMYPPPTFERDVIEMILEGANYDINVSIKRLNEMKPAQMRKQQVRNLQKDLSSNSIDSHSTLETLYQLFSSNMDRSLVKSLYAKHKTILKTINAINAYLPPESQVDISPFEDLSFPVQNEPCGNSTVVEVPKNPEPTKLVEPNDILINQLDYSSTTNQNHSFSDYFNTESIQFEQDTTPLMDTEEDTFTNTIEPVDPIEPVYPIEPIEPLWNPSTHIPRDSPFSSRISSSSEESSLRSSGTIQKEDKISFLQDMFSEYSLEPELLEIFLEDNVDMVAAVDSLLPFLEKEQAPVEPETDLIEVYYPDFPEDFKQKLKILKEMFPEEENLGKIGDLLTSSKEDMSRVIHILLGEKVPKFTPTPTPIAKTRRKRDKDITVSIFSTPERSVSPKQDNPWKAAPELHPRYLENEEPPDLASKLQLKKLTEQFYWIDSDFLKTVYARNNFAIKEALKELQEYGIAIPAKPIPIIKPKTPEPPKPKKRDNEPPRSANASPLDSEIQKMSYSQLIQYSIEQGDKRNECYRNATRMYLAKDGKSAREYSKLGQEYARRMALAQLRAAELLVSSQKSPSNSKKNSDFVVIDLHGFQSTSAMDVLSNVLDYYSRKPNIQYLQIVTGAGSNSVNGAVLKPLVRGFLKNKNLSFSPVGTGAFLVKLRKIHTQ